MEEKKYTSPDDLNYKESKAGKIVTRLVFFIILIFYIMSATIGDHTLSTILVIALCFGFYTRAEGRISSLTTHMREWENSKDRLVQEFTDLQTNLNHTKAELKKAEQELRDLLDFYGLEDVGDIRTCMALKTEIYNNKEQLKKLEKKLQRLIPLYKAIQQGIKAYLATGNDKPISKIHETEIDTYAPTALLHLKSLDVPELRKAFRDNNHAIDKILKSYQSRYKTKSTQAIYQLLAIGLKAELQNVLIELRYGKIETALEEVDKICDKYNEIAAGGNQTIAQSMNSFISEIRYLFKSAVKIEYTYYIKKEQARQEQLEIRQKMKEETEERRRLELERKRIENEELKYKQEIENSKEKLLATTDTSEQEQLRKRILELEEQLNNVHIEKDKIINLQNGKAGNVYIISNLGSFGENIFKIGMTRRLEPQDRINELGSASVPFKFDVHSFIFSDDAVALEYNLHQKLHDKRVNKLNPRKEFFYCTIDELEEIVHEIEPSAEFNRTMIADEYRRSIQIDEVN